MALRISSGCFSGAKRFSEVSLGSSTLIETRSANSAARSIRS